GQVVEMGDWLMGINTALASELPISPSVPRPTRALRLRDRFMADKRDILSGYEASEGVLYLLFGMVLACSAKSPQTFAIDNFDHALNPRLARAYAKSF